MVQTTMKKARITFSEVHNMQDKVELSPKRVEQLQKAPIVESSIHKSQDGKWVLHRTTITDIKPVNYMEKVMQA